MAAGILAEEPGGAAAGIGFSHLLVQRAVYGDLSPARRRRLHQRAAGLVDRDRALGHRVAAAAGPDDGLAAELEAAGREARRHGRTAQAAAWLAQAAAASSEPAAADRRLLDALEILVTYGEVAQAEALAARVAAAGPGARRSWLLGTLDFLAGRAAAAEARLRGGVAGPRPGPGRVRGRRGRHPAGGAVPGRGPGPGGDRMGRAGGRDRRRLPAAMRHRALGVLAIALVADGRGPEGLARLAFLPAAPAEVPREDTDALALRGMARILAEDLAGAIADLSTAAARLRAGVPLRSASLCLSSPGARRVAPRIPGTTRWCTPSWPSRSPATPTGCGSSAWCTIVAAVVPALRGDWEAASAHVEMAAQAARATGAPGRDRRGRHRPRRSWPWPAAIWRASPSAAAAVRATGQAQLAEPRCRYDWRSLEIDALIGLGRLGEAETALAELEAALSPAGPPSALVAAARLRGDLAAAAGHQAAAAAAFETAWRRAQGLRVPLALAQLEISDARRLRAAGQPQQAVARLRSARQRLITLGARPYVEICDRELAAAGAPAGPETTPALPGLTPAEQAVARLVAAGRSNRQAAAELYVSVKTVEFHLGHIFDKLGIRSRKDLIDRIGAAASPGRKPRVVTRGRPWRPRN